MKFQKVLHQLKQKYGNFKVIIFTDPGLDDALMLLQMLSSKKYPIAGIIPVAGNVDFTVAVQNTLNLCEWIQHDDVPIYSGSLPKIPSAEDIPVYGTDGLSAIKLPIAQKCQVKSQNGLNFAFEAVQKTPHFIISTAILTEPACLLQKLKDTCPEALRHIIGISMMGGVINAAQEANWPIAPERFSEANLAFDPKASQTVFEICAQFHIPIFLSPLDLTHSILASDSDMDYLRTLAAPKAQLALKLIQAVPLHYQERYTQGADKKYRQPLHDLHASNCLLHPELYTGHWVSLSVRDTIQPQQIEITADQRKNVFLLDMHYLYRRRFFELFAQDLR